MDFELELERNIFDLYRDLKNGIYKHGPYKGFGFTILSCVESTKQPSGTAFSIMLFSACSIQYFEPTFIPNSFSCRVGKGTHKGMKKVAEMLRTVSRNNIRQCYALKCDIRKFFDSVDHDILLEILDTRIKDKNCKFSIEKLFPVILAFTREREREYFSRAKSAYRQLDLSNFR